MREITAGIECERCIESIKLATAIVYEPPTIRNMYRGALVACCAKCRDEVISTNNPEYRVTCPNCKCDFGVN